MQQFICRVIEKLKTVLVDKNFINCHKSDPDGFIRNRVLTFAKTVGVCLEKRSMSSQNTLISAFKNMEDGAETVGASAFTQARAKLQGEVFLSLNRIVTEMFYKECEYKTWKSHRLLAVDGSKLYLPSNKRTEKKFGTIKTKNAGPHEGTYVSGIFSTLYDVYNELPIDSFLAPGDASERVLAQHHLKYAKPGDVILFDRGYAAFRLFAYMIPSGISFVCRCNKQFCKIACPELLDPTTGITNKVAKIRRPKATPRITGFKYPQEIEVRFVQVILSNGDIEILATSLFDENTYPVSCFGEVYHMRRGIETVYSCLKNNLELENFSGKTVASVYQDVYATVLFKTFESLFTMEANAKLAEKKTMTQLQNKTDVTKKQSINTR